MSSKELSDQEILTILVTWYELLSNRRKRGDKIEMFKNDKRDATDGVVYLIAVASAQGTEAIHLKAMEAQ